MYRIILQDVSILDWMDGLGEKLVKGQGGGEGVYNSRFFLPQLH